MFFVEQVEAVLASVLVFFFGVLDDSWRVVLEVGWHNCFCAVDHEEGSVSGRPVDRGAEPPQYCWYFFCPASWSALEWHLKARLEAVEDALIGALGLTVGFWMCDCGEVESNPLFLAEFCHLSFCEVCAVVRDYTMWIAEPVDEFSEELGCCLAIGVFDWFGFDPLGEFVDCDK